MRISKDNVIFALLGVIAGMFLTVFAGIFVYKAVKSFGQPARYAEPGQAQEKKSSQEKKAKAFNEFYLSFESYSDTDVFEGPGTSVEVSSAHATHGKHSLKVSIHPGSDYPGLQWEVYGSGAQNWTGEKDFHFDVYNNNEDTIQLQVKFKSGRDYPKKSYSYPAVLEPLKMNTISIPIDQIASSCDITQMSYVKFFVQSPQKEVVLYFDNIGVKQGTRVDEKSDSADSDNVTQDKGQAGIIHEKEEIFAASSLDRIFQDGKTLVKPDFTQGVDLRAAKNEYESFQVVVSNGRNELKDVLLVISDLVNDQSGAKLSKDTVNWRIVGYVPTKKPYYPVKFVGQWPDPLLSEEKINVQAGVTQPFWVTIYVPADAAAGMYRGTVQVVSDKGLLKELPVSLTVENFTLPLESHLKTAFDFYGHITAKRFPQKQNESNEMYSARIAEINEKFIINMLQHRMNPVLNIDPLSQNDLSRVDNYRKYGLNNFSIGKKGGTFNNNWPENDAEIEKFFQVYRGYGETLKFNNLLQNTYIYTWDESKMNDPQVAKVCSMIHRAYPGLKNMVCYHGFWDPVKNPDWGKDIDIWCFGIDDYNASQVKTLLDHGMEMWVYISGPSGSGSPNLAIDFDSIDYRIIPWLCWKYDLKGFLYWCVNWWDIVDPYVSAANTKWEQNGNGLLFYPGENGPVDSIRAEIYRDGMEDYEYFYLLKERLAEAKSKGLGKTNSDLIKQAEELLTFDSPLVSSMRSFTKDTRMLMERRKKIAETIGKLNN